MCQRESYFNTMLSVLISRGCALITLKEFLWKTITNEPCTVEQVAKVVDFFIANDMVTGQTIYLGGV